MYKLCDGVPSILGDDNSIDLGLSSGHFTLQPLDVMQSDLAAYFQRDYLHVSSMQYEALPPPPWSAYMDETLYTHFNSLPTYSSSFPVVLDMNALAQVFCRHA